MPLKSLKLRWPAKLGLAVLAFYLLCLAGLVLFQRSFLYLPETFYVSPAKAGAPEQLQEIKATTEDGLNLTGWYAPATSKKLTLIFFHGNADSLRRVAPLAGPYIAAGYGFLIVEYRGYSANPGHPSEVGLYRDARAFVKYLLASGVKEKNLVLYGHSLGTGVALQMAGEFKAAGLMLEAPYLSMADMAQLRFPFFPAGLLVEDRFDSFKKIPHLSMPLFLAHGDEDLVIPLRQGQALFDLAPQPKKMLLAHGGGHVNLAKYGFVEAALEWLKGL